MLIRLSRPRVLLRAVLPFVLLALAAGMSGCAQVGDAVSPAFADPARYDLYDCKQLETERKTLKGREGDQEALMKKAETGVGGTVVAEMVYRNELISIHGQMRLAEAAWRSNKCHETPPEAAPTPTPTPSPTPTPKGTRGPRPLIH